MSLDNNKHLKEVEKILNDWNVKEGYLTTNDIHGVDLISQIDITKLNLETEDEDEIAELLELHYDGSDYFFQRDKDGYHEFALTISTCEEIFITFENELCFPNDTKSVKLSSDNREIEIIAHALEWMHENGCFTGIYQLDYYSNSPESYNFYETNEYKALGLSDEDEKQKKEVARLVEVIKFQKELEETTLTVGHLPTEFYEAMPEILQRYDGDFEILSVDSFDAHTMTIEFEAPDYEAPGEEHEMEKLKELGKIKQGNNDISYIITISLLPNSVRFMKGLDDMLGLEVA